MNNITIIPDNLKHAEFGTLTVVAMKSFVFRDITVCRVVIVNWCFGVTCCLHLQEWRVSQARNQHEAAASRKIHLQKTWDYIRKKRELQDNWSVPLTFSEKQSEPIGNKRRVTTINPEKAHLSTSWTMEERSCKCIWREENRRGDRKEVVCGGS
jgi:hypothetical protein